MAFAILGTLLTQGVIVWYLAVINAEKVPVAVGPIAAAILAGLTLTVAAMALEPSAAIGTLLSLDLAVGGLILWLLTLRKMPAGQLTAVVGQPMPELATTDHTGAPFDLANLKRQRVMVKFFRGSW
ncbi:MAG: hypothetical protein ACI8PZ_005854 [Myxococcota bacterium]|jgi:hypothetical protein